MASPQTAAFVIDLSSEFKATSPRKGPSPMQLRLEQQATRQSRTIEDITRRLEAARQNRDAHLTNVKQAGFKQSVRVENAALTRQASKDALFESNAKKHKNATVNRAFKIMNIKERNARLVKKARSVAAAERKKKVHSTTTLKSELTAKEEVAAQKRQQMIGEIKSKLSQYHARCDEKLKQEAEKTESKRSQQHLSMQDAQLKRTLAILGRQQRLANYNAAVQKAAVVAKEQRSSAEGEDKQVEEACRKFVAQEMRTISAAIGLTPPPVDAHHDQPWRFATPVNFTRATEWSEEVEQAFRLQETGWLNIDDYSAAHEIPERWEDGRYAKLVTKDRGYFVYWGRERECKDEDVSSVLLARDAASEDAWVHVELPRTPSDAMLGDTPL